MATTSGYQAFSDQPLVDLAPGSAWIAERAGLADAAMTWHAEQVRARRDATARAKDLAQPRPHPRTIVAMVRIGTRFGALTLVGILASLLARVRGQPATSGAIRAAQSIVRAGGPAYVKAGQLVATATGVLPDAWTSAFAWCRDEVGPLRPGVAEGRVEEAFGRPLDQVFSRFDRTPLAAASIAQVHRAALLDGTEVIVKVQRPGLRRRFEDDVRVMAVLGALADRVSKSARVANVPGFVELFAEMAFEEIDFRFEALNMVEVGLANEAAGMGQLCHVPRPFPELVVETVLVMECMEGVRYTDADATYAHLDGRALVRLAMSTVLEQSLMYGVFHGDLHAGNVLVRDDLSFSLVDFGIIGRVTATEREALIRMLIGFTRQDVRAQVEAIAEFDVLPPGIDLAELAAEFEQTSALLVAMADAPLAEVDFEAMSQQVAGIIRVMSSHGFRAPKELVLFSKNLLYLNGLAQVVARDINILEEIEPMMLSFVTKYPAALATIVGLAAQPAAEPVSAASDLDDERHP
jgi:ubiquinone biosynthesis protein